MEQRFGWTTKPQASGDTEGAKGTPLCFQRLLSRGRLGVLAVKDLRLETISSSRARMNIYVSDHLCNEAMSREDLRAVFLRGRLRQDGLSQPIHVQVRPH